MITNTKQVWTSGSIVKVGFMTLTVVAAIATPGDYKPDAYIVASKTQAYLFIPHNGLEKITNDEARRLMIESRDHAARIAAKAIARASAESSISALIAELAA